LNHGKALAAAKAFFVAQIYALFLQLLKISYWLLQHKKIKKSFLLRAALAKILQI